MLKRPGYMLYTWNLLKKNFEASRMLAHPLLLWCKILFNLIVSLLQILTSVTSVLVNTFCGVILLVSKDLRNMDFLLVIIQTISDLIFTGILGSTLYSMEMMVALMDMCQDLRVFDECHGYARFVHLNYQFLLCYCRPNVAISRENCWKQ